MCVGNWSYTVDLWKEDWRLPNFDNKNTSDLESSPDDHSGKLSIVIIECDSLIAIQAINGESNRLVKFVTLL